MRSKCLTKHPRYPQTIGTTVLFVNAEVLDALYDGHFILRPVVGCEHGNDFDYHDFLAILSLIFLDASPDVIWSYKNCL